MIMRGLVVAVAVLVSFSSRADVTCVGTVKAVYKWADMQKLSVQIKTQDGVTTPWISMPTKSDEAMALTALATGMDVGLYWASTDITSCAAGWADNRVLDGYMAISQRP